MRIRTGSTSSSNGPRAVRVLSGEAGSSNPNFRGAVYERQRPSSSLLVGSLETNHGSGHTGFNATGLRAENQFPGDSITLSAEALSLSAQSTAISNENETRLAAGFRASIVGADADFRLGDEGSNITAGFGVGLGVGLGFDVGAIRNENGTRTVNADLGVSLLGRLNLSGSLTTIGAERQAEIQREYEQSGLADAPSP